MKYKSFFLSIYVYFCFVLFRPIYLIKGSLWYFFWSRGTKTITDTKDAMNRESLGNSVPGHLRLAFWYIQTYVNIFFIIELICMCGFIMGITIHRFIVGEAKF